ncbi:type II toxin-antitoxin system VapC family toxin [soil metagenome]
MRIYLDSSAIVKLVQREAESEALRHYLRRYRREARVTSTLARVEVVRAVRAGGPEMVALARRQLGRFFLVPLERTLLDEAAELGGATLRSLDAVHLAAARRIGEELRSVVTYDVRMQVAAQELGLRTATPG